ncbi:MAG: hypothetical protein JW741_01035, partial [Sedimentisphaerales bacterium]|nr:hypothetical protein [Sedimentisphaerales bacterium]
ETVEKAYWWTEVLDAYCRMLMLARGLGRINYFTEPEAQALLDLKGQWGFKDPRNQMQNCDICANDAFRDTWQATGVQQTAFTPPHYPQSSQQPLNPSPPAAPSSNGQAAPDQEALIQAITDRVMESLQQQS